MVEILAVGISHKTAPVEVREQFSFSDANLREALAVLSARENISECCIVSTCNRVEIYAVTENLGKCEKEIKSFLADFHGISGDSLDRCTYALSGKAAAGHLFRVASSVDSMVLGETQILGQLKNSHDVARLEKASGLILNRLFNKASFTGKKVRTETGISSQAVSVSHLGVELAKRIFENLANRTAMLVGTGEMGEIFARYLVSNKIRDLYVTGRNFESARELSRSLGAKPVRFEELLYCLKDVDILVTATGSSDYIIRSEHVRQSLRLRKNDPVFMIDIAVPRDIDPRINEIPGVYLYDIDDLRTVQDVNLNSRKKSLAKAEEIISGVEKSFMDWMESLRVFPVIIDLGKKFERIRAAEVEKAVRKLEGNTGDGREIVEGLASSIIGKIFHDPATSLKKTASGYEGAVYSEAARTLFGLGAENTSREEADIDDEAENWNQG